MSLASRKSFAPATLGFFLGVGASVVSGLALYVWYCGRRPPRLARTASQEKEDAEERSFLTDIVAALWKHINAVAISQIQETCQPILEQLQAYPFKNLHFTRITLGEVPIRMDHVQVHSCQKNPLTKQDGVQISLDLIWDGACDIQLQSGIGPLGIQSIQIQGRMSILLQPLTDASSSIIGAVQYAFVNTPELQLVDFTGLAQVADLQSIKNTIQSSILHSIEETMVLPNRSLLKMAPTISYLQIYQPPLGVARITLQEGAGFTDFSSLTGRDRPDLYCTLQVGAMHSWTSTVVANSVHPVWPQPSTWDVLLEDREQMLRITVRDDNRDQLLQGDRVVGTAQLTVGQLLAAPTHHMTVPLYDGKQGTLTGASIQLHGALLSLVPELDSLKCTFFSSSPGEDAMDASSFTGISGLITVVVSQAFDLPIAEQTSYMGDASHIRVTFGSTQCRSAVASGVHPTYDASFRIPLYDGANLEELPPVVLSVMDGTDDDDTAHCYGSIPVPISELWAASPDHIISGRRFLDPAAPPAQLEFLVALQGVAPRDGCRRSLQLTVQEGGGFLPACDEASFLYCEVQWGSHATWRTTTVPHAPSPRWNERRVYPMAAASSSANWRAQMIRIDVWSPTENLGHARVSVGKLLEGGTQVCELLLAGQPTQAFVQLHVAWTDA